MALRPILADGLPLSWIHGPHHNHNTIVSTWQKKRSFAAQADFRAEVHEGLFLAPLGDGQDGQPRPKASFHQLPTHPLTNRRVCLAYASGWYISANTH